jgi:hypothetical protein
MLSAGRILMTPKLIIPPKTYVNGQPWRLQHVLNSSQSGDLGAFTYDGTINLPVARSYCKAVVTKNYVYLLGGGGAGVNNTSIYAAINSSGVIVAPWMTGPTLPFNITGNSMGHSIMLGNKLYLIGNGTSAVTYWCTVNPDGTLDGNWQTGTSLPTVMAPAGVFVTKNKIYTLGGTSGVTQATKLVNVASIAADGTIGAWSSSTPFTDSIRSQSHVAVCDGQYVYLIAGFDSGSGIGQVTKAPINVDGTLGAWSVGSPIPGNFYCYSSAAVVTKNTLYLLGGSTNTSFKNVYIAALDPNGLAGAWSTGTAFAVNMYAHQAIITSSRIYMLGTTGSLFCYYAGFAGGSNDYTDKTYV